MRAIDLAARGWTQDRIGLLRMPRKGPLAVGLTPPRSAGRSGADALRSHPSPGRPTKLTTEQVRLIPDFLWHCAEAYGFRGDVWNCERVVGVLYEEFGVSYSKSQVSRLLSRLDWSA